MTKPMHLTATGRRIVVAGAIIRDGLLLAARRLTPVELAGRWELPGGKVDVDELPRDAMRRELIEELGIDVQVNERLAAPPDLAGAVDGDWPLTESSVLRVYHVDILGGDVTAGVAHDEIRWLGRDDLMSVAWLPADVAPAAALIGRLAASPAARPLGNCTSNPKDRPLPA